MKVGKTHYAMVSRANESDTQDYWSYPVCGLKESESPLTDKISKVTCKKCLKQLDLKTPNL